MISERTSQAGEHHKHKIQAEQSRFPGFLDYVVLRFLEGAIEF
jgi:hypothetical protein